MSLLILLLEDFYVPTYFLLKKFNVVVISEQILIREEVKEKLKWNVDRTSPSNKIRDLMDWTRDIMQDISYQRKILFNPIAIMFTKGWYVHGYHFR
jgi:inositol 1,4,5-triphosphate receptor type 1